MLNTPQLLAGKRILITHADKFMGPTLCDTFSKHGAIVIADDSSLLAEHSAKDLIQQSGTIDILVVNLSIPAPNTAAEDVDDNEWRDTFAALVDPLPRLCRAVLPQMIKRQEGKILVMGSASALRGIKYSSTYCAARGSQISYVQAVGIEMAKHNIQINAIAQNFVDNPTYFPEEIQNNPKFQARLKNEVPLGRLVGAVEDAEFAAYLCSDNANCFVGQVFPVCGGWVGR